MDIKEQLIALGTTIAIAVLGYAIAWVRNKIVNGKLASLEPLVAKLETELPKYFLPVLQNIYQKHIKPIYHGEQWTTEKQTEVFNLAFDELVKTLPDFLLKIVKTIKADWQEMLKARLAEYLEINKSKINVVTPTI
jgi:hypothetical protein